MLKKLIYVIPKEKHSEKDIKDILLAHSEVKFVSLVGIDLSGNDTDERIPMKIFLDDISGFSNGVIQTDGSSVVLPGIATLNNAKLDMLADADCNWYIDYNYENIDPETQLPIGTLKVPCTLLHDKIPVDSRSILKRSVETFKTTLLDLLKENPSALSSFDFEYKDIDNLMLTSATELEFWVKTPNDKADIEELSTSQVLKEQYWSKTKGNVRTALEQTLLLMQEYGFEPEMGHKEVGGVKAQIGEAGSLTHIMEQLEIDWKYSDALQCADNELFIRNLVKETFRINGLDVNFLAKPVHDVAGSGEHTHIGIAVKLKSGKRVNLFNSDNNHFLSTLGYASVMGVLKNYEVINPFVSSTNDSLRRLKVGFEAPICIVTSLGHSVDVPSRNRSILLALIRDLDNPLATRFELRAPCPHTNTYLALSTLYMGMLDGIVYAIKNNKSEDDLLKELSKAPGDDADYLEKDRAYRSEEDVFEYYTEAQRADYFGKAPKTVYENVSSLDEFPTKLEILKTGDVFTTSIINSFRMAITSRWVTEINNRLLNNYAEEIRKCKMIHTAEKALDLDLANWQKVNDLRHALMKDTYSKTSLFTKINEASNIENYKELSTLQIQLDAQIEELRFCYSNYKKNLLDI
ncbi:type I glutamate--ammonia ligase [Clostridium estertheticum]|uniref:glutamine synthetase n=1 Tax=Clostridium estertheticum TaxID=238834 RepID=UPI001C0B1664|nr:glutamine synthetase [Clostridium estertheticum]MBU3074687.1 glutamine synthetase [Clostridium estertheticum]MBU3164601.1 glutamine synthetase [Clostridium estertheticum]MBU3174313.1 glutamine synthetase [Clostridium estertheticum]MBU3185523.1 glutamine synthetase [Clostridium estertheticum]MCB2341950.1 glutamine synthetase [Clostridium estertheticum]